LPRYGIPLQHIQAALTHLRDEKKRSVERLDELANLSGLSAEASNGFRRLSDGGEPTVFRNAIEQPPTELFLAIVVSTVLEVRESGQTSMPCGRRSNNSLCARPSGFFSPGPFLLI
jgi:hypothetical protein